MEDKYKAMIAGVGLVCITAIEYKALELGIDSVLFGSVIGAITFIVGLCFGIVVGKKQ